MRLWQLLITLLNWNKVDWGVLSSCQWPATRVTGHTLTSCALPLFSVCGSKGNVFFLISKLYGWSDLSSEPEYLKIKGCQCYCGPQYLHVEQIVLEKRSTSGFETHTVLELNGSIYIAPHGVSLVEPEGRSWQTQPVFLRLLTVHHTLFHTIGTGGQPPSISARISKQTRQFLVKNSWESFGGFLLLLVLAWVIICVLLTI